MGKRRKRKEGMVKKKRKGRRKGDMRRRFSRRRPRLVGHARAAFVRCARRGGDCVGADRGGWSRVGDRPPSGAEWDGGHVRVGCQGGRGKRRGLGLGFGWALTTIRFLIERF
jgi:hypothetical protein